MINPILWIFAIPLLASPLDYLVGRLTSRNTPVIKKASPARLMALITLLVTWIPFYLAVQTFRLEGVIKYTYGTINLRLDGVSLVLAGSTLLLATLVVIFSGPYIAGEDGEEKYYALISVMTGAIIGLSCANDLFNLWVWFETMAISSYMLVAFYRNQPPSLEAGFKYITQSAAGSALVLLGIALVFAQTGTLDLAQIKIIAEETPMLLAAGALFIIGFGVKAALVPLHTWLPDAHSQAPSGISALLSGVVIEVGLVALLRALGALAGVTSLWGPILLGFAAVNMLTGNMLALRQTQLKRLLAFSSISHMGYILLGLGIAITYNQSAAAEGAMFHLINHMTMKGLAFLAAGAILYGLYISHGKHGPLLITDLAGASRRYPIAAFTFAIAVFGLGGLPPLSGFMSKWQIFVAGFQSLDLSASILVIFAALNSVLSLGYYAPLVNLLYRREASPLVNRGQPLPGIMNVSLVFLALTVIILGIWPILIEWLTAPAGADILSAFSR